jgi:predicted RNA binding protein YcfA (HicA-like mRNA interferase family)
LRIAGSHRIYGKQDSVVRLPIPVHSNRALKTVLVRHLLKLAEMSEDDV